LLALITVTAAWLFRRVIEVLLHRKNWRHRLPQIRGV